MLQKPVNMPEKKRIEEIVSALLSWFDREQRQLPWRQDRDPYAIWVSEIMLQQTQVQTVLPYWHRWMAALPDVRSLAAASSRRIHKLWEGLGYYNRVRNMQRAARQIRDQHDGIFPRDVEALQSLPGIGRYTAGAICSIAFDQPAPIVDGNVLRVLTRAVGIGGNPRRGKVNAELWSIAQELVSEADRRRGRGRERPVWSPAWPCPCSSLNQALMELGALVCTPQKPLCQHCPLAPGCVALRQNRVDRLPDLPPRAAATPLLYYAFVAEKNGRYLVRQRPANSINAQLWEFPNVQVNRRTAPAGAAREVLGVKPRQIERRLIIKHAITRFRITLEVFGVEGFSGAVVERARWLTPEQLGRLALPSAHKKILMRLPLDETRFILPPTP